MRRSHVVATSAVLVAALAAVALTGPAPAARSPLVYAPLAVGAANTLSTNWAGYAATSPDPGSPISFTSVTATWTQAAATCQAGDADSASAFWVGLGGYSDDSQAVEQIGTDSDCSRSGVPSYYAWYELVPAPPVTIKLKIKPGDTITASVNVSGNTVLFQLKNRTKHTVFTKRLAADVLDLTSAEWIAEAPSLCTGSSCATVPLANFGSVAFSRVATIGNGHPGTLTDSTWSTIPIQLVPRARSGGFFGEEYQRRFTMRSSTAGTSVPAGLTPEGRAFTLSWAANPTAGS